MLNAEGESALFDVTAHGLMVGDRVRTEAYRRAIAAVVRSGDVVVDIGTGTGILALFACGTGAARVYAIEKDDVIQVAREMAAANGMEDRVILMKGAASEIALPEKADVLITETLGALGLEEGILSLVIDARSRFLRGTARLVPERLTLWTVPVEAADAYAAVAAWDEDWLGLDLGPARTLAVNSQIVATIEPASFLGTPVPLASIDLGAIEAPFFEDSARFTATREGTLYGIAGWFEATLAPGVTLTNSPLAPSTHWEQAFFPIEKPTPLRQDEALSLSLTWSPFIGAGAWRWRVQVREGRAECTIFDHSTAAGFPISQETMAQLRAKGERKSSREKAE